MFLSSGESAPQEKGRHDQVRTGVFVMKTRISDLPQQEGKLVELQGWVYQVRSSGKIAFIVLRDGSGFCQCVFTKDRCGEGLLKRAESLTLECAVRVTGLARKRKEEMELQAESLSLFHKSRPYPIGKKAHGPDFLLSRRHLWLRSKKQRALMRIRNRLTQNIHSFFQKEGFLQMDAPLLTPTSCEGASSLFSVNFFNSKEEVYLSQSGQLYMEAAAAAHGRVYCFGPVFRAEKSSTRRHLLEFWMLEPEMAFFDLNQAMETAEAFLESAIQNTVNASEEELRVLGRDPASLKKARAPFPRLSYEEASGMLKGFRAGDSFGAPQEAAISSRFEKPVFVHRYPKKIKAFYMKEDPEDKNLSLSFDLLATEGFGEIIGGGQREDDLQKLQSRLRACQLPEESFEWYLDLRRYGSFPHSGFGLGLERLVAWIGGLNHVREAIPFPRLYARTFFETPLKQESSV